MLKMGDNPPPRWPQDRPLEEDKGKWWVVRTKPRNEKALAWELLRMGASYYLPLITKRSVRADNGKPRKSVVCLFPGYISIASLPAYKNEIYRTGRVYKALEVIDQEKFVRELYNVQLAVSSCLEVQQQPSLSAGQRVIITAGSMQGIEGVVAGRKDNSEIVHLNVEMFSQSISVKVPREWLEDIEYGAAIAL